MCTVCREEHGEGLSATQIGEPLRLFVVVNKYKYTQNDDSYDVYANCQYSPSPKDDKELFSSVEGCLSLKDRYGTAIQYTVPRHKNIVVRGLKINFGCEQLVTEIAWHL